MTAIATDAATVAHRDTQGVRSKVARQMLEDLLAYEPEVRGRFVIGMPAHDREELFAASRQELGSAYGLWQDDPLGFNEVVLGQSLWSLQRQVAHTSGRAKVLAVPSCTTVGKTFIAAGLVLHHGSVWPQGMATAVTTATRYRQVQRQLWPEIRQLGQLARLPGKFDMTQWTVPGVARPLAYGLTAPVHDEAAVQGIHAPKLLILIDEAGGIHRAIGDGFVNLTTGGDEGDVHLVAIGNPPTDDEASWFEDLTTRDGVATVVIDALRSPNMTGEHVGRCRTCPPEAPEHSARRHLIKPADVRRTAKDHGKDSPFYVAKVRAKFPKGGPSRVLPGDWLDFAREQAVESNGREEVSRNRLGVPFPYQPVAGAWIRLGVDVAADGGDELAVARCEGEVVRVTYSEAGPFLANAVDVAGRVLKEIREAQNLADALGTVHKVRVKIDGIGVGWGVAGILEAWGSEGLHDADIVVVNVAESVEEGRRDDSASMRPRIKRDEMWLAMRSLIQPDEWGEQGIVLDVDEQTRAQLGNPRMGTRTDGTTFIESKKSMKARGLRSPDRGEAVLLAAYEPFDLDAPPRRSVIRAGA